ncbi:hypothetical protein JTE90_013079 [Oedothorax gibbosus]|uniref:Major facilitator superfamily (MFS) profile domain-containing protein n=1 Tax=Oedothorax gibbosus TaxID=931172 RepID=A0AAV6UKF0_9ARAC|nr:hypothetical protein JTE90_013079 [Oedothorax gibbosus]
MGADSPRSWVIAAACCWVTFVIQGLVRSGGVIYVALIDAYGVTRAQASWPFTLRMAIWNLSGPLAGALSYRWSIRTIAFCGVLLVTITNMACWLTSHDIYLVTFLLGGLQGLGVGMAVTLVPVIINQWFVKYKSSGAGLACAGATAGSFALPPVVELAVEEYGLAGSFLLMAGITLQGVLGAALMRPAAWLDKKETTGDNRKSDQNLNFITTKSKNAPEVEEITNLLNGEEIRPSKSNKTVRFSCNDQHCAGINNEDDCLIENSQNIEIVQSNGTPSVADIRHPTTNSSDQDQNIDIQSEDNELQSVHYGHLQFVDNKTEYDPQINIQTIYVPVEDSQQTRTILKPSSVVYQPTTEPNDPKGFMEPLMAAMEIAKNPMFLIIASNYSIFFLSYMTYLIVIVDYSLDLGIDRTDCVFLVSTFSIADLVGRLGSGWITDSGIVKRKHLMMGNMVIFGALLVATSFATTYMAVTAVSVSAGLVVGVNLILFYALLEEYLGIRKLPMAIGLMNFSIGVVSLVTPLLTGYFRDTMGSYDHLFHLLGGVSIFCGLLWTLEPLHAACSK